MKLACAALLAVLFLPSFAAAQGRGVFIQAGPLADLLFTPTAEGDPGLLGLSGSSFTWNDTNGDRRWQPGEETPFLPTGNLRQSATHRATAGGLVAVAVFLSPSISLRLEGSFQGGHRTTAESSDQFIRSLSTTVQQTSSATDLLAAVGWHQGEQRRVSINYLGGMVFRRQRNEATLTETYQALVIRPGGATSTQDFTDEALFNSTDFRAGVMVGLDTPIKLSAHTAIVPQLRMLAVRNEWNLRPAVTLRWHP